MYLSTFSAIIAEFEVPVRANVHSMLGILLLKAVLNACAALT